MNRRELLQTAGATVALAASPWLRARESHCQIGLQLFSLDEDMHKNVAQTLHAVRAIGYRQVELVGFYGMDTAALRRALGDAQLHCQSIHIRPHALAAGVPSLDADADPTLARCRDLGVTYLVCPGPWFPRHVMDAIAPGQRSLSALGAAAARMTREDWQDSAMQLNQMGERARRFGLQFLYHNGNAEFMRLGNQNAFDLLLAQTDPHLVGLELDCGWVQAGGADPLHYLAIERGRVQLVHVKDMTQTAPNTQMQLNPAQLGEGVVDLPALMSAADHAGVHVAYIEQEAPFSVAPLEAARHNYEYLSRLKY